MTATDMENLIHEFRSIPHEFLTRVVYETIPYEHRASIDRRLMDMAIKPLDPDMSVVGPAYTVNDAKMCGNVIEHIPEGHVLVVNAKGAEGTFIGCLMTRMMQQNKIAGIVIDGYVTHAARVRKMGLPIFCKGSTIRYSGYAFEGQVQVPVPCGGVLVRPGDLILGNADGVMVLDPAEAVKLLVGAKKIMEISRVFLEDFMNKGVRYFDIPGVRDFWKVKTSGEGEEWKIYDQWLKDHGY